MIRPLVCVTLCINSELTAPDFWTRYFGVEPDYSGRKGEPITTTLGRLASGDGRINSWVVASETAVESGSLDNHLAYIIERLKLPRSDLPNVLAENFSTLLCFFSWDNRIGEPRPDMSKILLEKFSQSGIVIEDGMTVGIKMLIAKRLLTYRANGIDSSLEIRIFAPQQQDKGFACRFEIDWPEGTSAKSAFGVDSVQALELALQMIGITLYTSSYHRLGQIFFELEGSGYGFPVPTNVRDMLIGDDLAQF